MSSVRVDPAIIGEDDDAELTTWLASDGAFVEGDQPIAEITAAKVVTEVPAPAAGRLRPPDQGGGTALARPGDRGRRDHWLSPHGQPSCMSTSSTTLPSGSRVKTTVTEPSVSSNVTGSETNSMPCCRRRS